jgi:hypothetical protein
MCFANLEGVCWNGDKDPFILKLALTVDEWPFSCSGRFFFKERFLGFRGLFRATDLAWTIRRLQIFLSHIENRTRLLGHAALNTVTIRLVFRYFTPLVPRKFCAAPPPPLICSYSVMCKQKQHKKLTKDKT